MLKINIVSIPVLDQKIALDFYTNKLGFVKKRDIPVGEDRWLTVVQPHDQYGIELLLEPGPKSMEACEIFQKALYEKGIPWTGFGVDNIRRRSRSLERTRRRIFHGSYGCGHG